MEDLFNCGQLRQHWSLTVRTAPDALVSSFLARYPKIPNQYLAFLQHFESLTTHDQTGWFNSIADFNGLNSANAFAWNEWETQSLDALANDDAAQAMVRTFWDQHLPIAMSVRQGFAYFALGVGDSNQGLIYYGSEPEYEEPELISSNFELWLSDLLQVHPIYEYADLLRTHS